MNTDGKSSSSAASTARTTNLKQAWANVTKALKWLVAYLSLIFVVFALLAAFVLQMEEVPAPDILKGYFPVGDERSWTIALSSSAYVSVVAALLFILKDICFAVIDIIWGKVARGVLRLTIGLIGAAAIGAIPFLVWSPPTPPCPKDFRECTEQGVSSRCSAVCLGHIVTEVGELTNDAIVKERRRTALVDDVSSPLLFENAVTSQWMVRRRTIEGGLPHDIEVRCDKVFERGVALREGHKNQLRQAIAKLESACRNPEDIALDVASSSSQAPFKGWNEAASARLNTMAANCRGESVEAELHSLLREMKLDIDVNHEDWESKAAIERHSFSGVAYHELQDPGFQSRSVVVRVEDAAKCFS